MRLLLDTHVVLWWMELNPKLTSKMCGLIDDPDNEPILSVVSLWEIAVKTRTGKLKADIAAIIDIAEKQRFTRLAVEDSHLEALLGLPAVHRDPFDQLLIAQAIVEGAALMTRDKLVARYPVKVLVA